MVRVCRPGGHVAVLEFSLPSWQPFGAFTAGIFATCCRGSARLWLEIGKRPTIIFPASVGDFPQGEAMAERMRAAGLARLRIVPLTLGVATLYVGTK